MGGMLRLKDDEALADLLKRSNLRISHDSTRRSPAATSAPKQPKAPAKTPRQAKQPSAIEEMMRQQILVSPLPQPACWPAQEHYLPTRNWYGDFIWREFKVGLEVDGGAHCVRKTFAVSFDRAFALWEAGWTVIHVGDKEVRSGRALEWVTIALQRGGWKG